jgi:chemotaxis protein methyltransferase CheR
MTLLGLTRFSDYLVRLVGPDAEIERLKLLSVLTTNVTHFFREAHHFDTLSDVILDPLINAAQRGSRVRFWSAGCSTGQEA